MAANEKVEKPIFIIGCPRSGTNAFYYKMAQHPELCWISNITKKIPDSLLLTRLLMLFRKDHRPTEARNIWGRFTSGDNDFLSEKDATPGAGKTLHRIIHNQMVLFGKKRFVNKCPRNSVRIKFLNEIFPDAQFIHIVRDGRAAANSILRARKKHNNEYWGIRPPGWQKLLDMPLLEACALQWKLTVECALETAKIIPPERYTEIKYEHFCEHPADTLRDASAKCGLTWDEAALRNITADIQSRNYKWKENFSPEEIKRLNDLIGPLLEKLGYPL